MADPRAESILHEALAAPPDEREALLRERCADDESLLAEVRSLLRFADGSSAFLEPGAEPTRERPPTGCAPGDASPGAGTHPEDELMPGEQVGPYTIVQRLGEGGFGVVYDASQSEPIRRRVALKVIKRGMDTKQVLDRFEAERQALALMNHPGITKIFDAGTGPSGTPYFAMELVRGVPISDYCRDRALPLRERLELFMDVCRAVHHAHQKGIIHRDLKPSNILVTDHEGEPMPKVIDFGIAKAVEGDLVDRSMFTRIGQIIGTLEYMSPEQVELSATDVDIRSDIYSLGVVLYEILTGDLPHTRARMRDAAWDELRRIIREEPPPKPSTKLSSVDQTGTRPGESGGVSGSRLGRRLRGDVDWIVLKSLEKDRTRRYDSATALAADLARYLNNEPVSAGPPSATYRVRKFVNRHRVTTSAAALIALSLVLGSAATTWQWRRAVAAQRTAEQRYELVRDMAGDFLHELGSEVDGLEGETATRRLLANTSRRVLESLEPEFGDDPELLLSLAKAHQQVGRVQRDSGDLVRDAVVSFQRALQILDSTDGPRTDTTTETRTQAERRRVRAHVRLDLAKTYPRVGRGEDAAAEYDRIVAETAARAEQADAEPQDVFLHSRALMLRGTARVGRGDPAGALDDLDRSVAMRQSLADANPTEPRWTSRLADAFDQRGRARVRAGDAEGGIGDYRRSLALRDALAERQEEPRNLRLLSSAHARLSSALMASGRSEEGQLEHDRAMAVLERIRAAEPHSSRSDALAQAAYFRLARLLLRRDNPADALPQARAAVAFSDRLLSSDPANLEHRFDAARAEVVLAQCLQGTDEPEDALRTFKAARTRFRQLSDLDSSIPVYRDNAAYASLQIASLHTRLGRPADAETVYRALIDERATRLEPGGTDAYLSNASRMLAEMLDARGEHEAAAQYFERAERTAP